MTKYFAHYDTDKENPMTRHDAALLQQGGHIIVDEDGSAVTLYAQDIVSGAEADLSDDDMAERLANEKARANSEVAVDKLAAADRGDDPEEVEDDGEDKPETKEELLERARELDVAGRSSMKKDELEKAVAKEEKKSAKKAKSPGDEARAKLKAADRGDDPDDVVVARSADVAPEGSSPKAKLGPANAADEGQQQAPEREDPDGV